MRGSKHINVRLFTFDNHPPQHLWNYFQIWVGGLVNGKGHYVIKPEDEEMDQEMRRGFSLSGYTKQQIDDIMNFIYKKL